MDPSAVGPGGAGLARADALLASGRAEAAAELLQRALASQPESYDLLIRLTSALDQLGRHPQAVRVAEQAVAAAPAFPEAHSAHAQVLTGAGDLKGALRAADRALELDPTEAMALQLKALLELEIGSRQAARAAAERLRAVEPDEAMAHRVDGLVCRAERRWEHAEAAYRRALSLQPDDPTCLHELGQLLTWMERQDEGVGLMRAAVQSDPEDRSLRESAVETAAYNDPWVWVASFAFFALGVADFLYDFGELGNRFFLLGLSSGLLVLQFALWWKGRRALTPADRDFLARAAAESRSLAETVVFAYPLALGFWLSFGASFITGQGRRDTDMDVVLIVLTVLVAGIAPFLPSLHRQMNQDLVGTLTLVYTLLVPISLLGPQYDWIRDGVWRATPPFLAVAAVTVLALGLLARAWFGSAAEE